MKNQNQKGQSLFEVVVALAIASLIIFALVSLTSNAIRNTVFSKNKTLASKYAQEANEWLRSQRDSDPEVFINNTLSPVWCLDSLDFVNVGACSASETVGTSIFLREVSFVSTTQSGKSIIEATITVRWEDAQGTHEVVSVTNFTDWRQI